MALIRCNKCGTLAEQAESVAGQNVPCPNCGALTPAYPTLFFVQKLLGRFFDAQREIARLKEASASSSTNQPVSSDLDEIDLSNTDLLANELQHGPIYDWFHKRQIKVQTNLGGVDTSGFFDEVAEKIGAQLPVLREVLDRIRWSQRKGHASTNINLNGKPDEHGKAIIEFTQQLYDFSFVAKRFHNRPEKSIRLILQSAPAVRAFFDGDWLEWHALMVCLRHAKSRGRRFSCARGLNLTFANGDPYEIDVFMLIDGSIPVCIECKSGEFRQDIERYIALKKRLHLEQPQLIMCVAGLPDDSAKAMSAMYNLAFVNERNLAEHLPSLL
jgi:hypothetical protein